MKKIILTSGFVILLTALGLRGYFTFVPPPEATLHVQLTDIVPSQLSGWKVRDLDMAESPESSARITDFLNFDDALFRVFEKGDTFVGLYIAYWTPGKTSYRWAGAHTPGTCWGQSRWTRIDREYNVPFSSESAELEPAEFGIYEKVGNAFGYEQQGGHHIFGALLDIKHHGLNLSREQFFIRLSSNKRIEELKKIEGVNKILESLKDLGLNKKQAAL
jgi:hypothetical protein